MKEVHCFTSVSRCLDSQTNRRKIKIFQKNKKTEKIVFKSPMHTRTTMGTLHKLKNFPDKKTLSTVALVSMVLREKNRKKPLLGLSAMIMFICSFTLVLLVNHFLLLMSIEWDCSQCISWTQLNEKKFVDGTIQTHTITRLTRTKYQKNEMKIKPKMSKFVERKKMLKNQIRKRFVGVGCWWRTKLHETVMYASRSNIRRWLNCQTTTEKDVHPFSSTLYTENTSTSV